jgi:hypothetical protein
VALYFHFSLPAESLQNAAKAKNGILTCFLARLPEVGKRKVPILLRLVKISGNEMFFSSGRTPELAVKCSFPNRKKVNQRK